MAGAGEPRAAMARVLLPLLAAALLVAGAAAREQVEMAARVEAATEEGRPITIPLAMAMDNERHTAVLLALKERQHRVSLLETGAEVGSKEVPLNVEILSTKHLATYYGTIQIRETPFKVLFDTGSCEFWVPSASCKTARCMKHARLPLDKSDAAHLKYRNGMNIQYLSGHVRGDMLYETVTLGDIKVENQIVGVGKEVNIELLDDVRWDGILGLAYPNPTLTNRGITPIFDTIIKSKVLSNKHLSNQFAYYISDTRGSVTFGGADCDLIAKGQTKGNCIDQFKFVPVTEQTYWTVTINEVRVKHPDGRVQKFCSGSPCKAIVDTGTYLIYGPRAQVDKMGLTTMTGCGNTAKMPTFTFDFHVKPGESAVALELRPVDYILKFKMEGNAREDCVVGISPDQDVIWTLGQVFLRSFYSVFDRDENRIGFARLPRQDFAAINSESTMKVVKHRTKVEAQKTAEMKQAAIKKGIKVAFRQTGSIPAAKTTPRSSFRARMLRKESQRMARLGGGHRFAEQQQQQRGENSLLEQREGADTGLVARYDGLRHVRYERV